MEASGDRSRVNLRNVDLNLLVAFDVLMRERHVTRAARRLGVGQPAMSASLSRLRHLFHDDLLVKQGTDMAPTARALALEPEVRRFLKDVESLIVDKEQFDPATSTRSFVLRMSDLLSFLFLPDLLTRIGVAGSGVALEVRHLSPDATVDALERNELDLAVSTGLDIPKSIECRRILEDRIVCVLPMAHPCAAGFDDVDTFVNLPQIRVSQSPLDDRFVDHQLAASGLDRKIALTVPHWLVVPEIIARTGLAAVMPHSVAARFAGTSGLQVVPPPIEECGFMWCLYWHRRHNSDAGHQWLRQLILDVSGTLN